VEEKFAAAEAVGAEGDLPEPSLAPSTVEMADAIKPELEKALASAEPAPSKDLSVTDPSPTALGSQTQQATASLGGKAPEEGDVAAQEQS